MRTRSLVAVLALAGCHHESPAGTVVFDWTYASDAEPAPVPRHPQQRVASDQEWPAKNGAVKLHFETEIGDLSSTDGTRWSWPRHVHITLAEPTKVELPRVDCMPAPPGNTVDAGVLVRPLGKDGVPKGVVACFVNGREPSESFVYTIDGEGKITRSVPSH